MTEDNDEFMDEPIELTLDSESLLEEEKESCLPCQALDHLCKILPEEDGKKACEEIKEGLENDTMTAEEARDYLAQKVGRQILATKLAEVSEWITEQEVKRQQRVASNVEAIPLEEETIIEKMDDLPPLPEEMTKPIEEISPIDYLDTETEYIEPKPEPAKPKKKSDDFVKYNPDDEIIYKDLFDTEVEDDPSYMYDDEDIWLEDGLIGDEF